MSRADDEEALVPQLSSASVSAIGSPKVDASVQVDVAEIIPPVSEDAQGQPEFPWKLTPEERYPPPNPEQFTEFEKRYPPDRFGEEAGPNARVWRLYRDRVTDLDEDLLQGWHETLNVLLIFAGLFSAVATAFIIEGTKRLQHDYTEYTARGVFALLARLDDSVVAPTQLPDLNNFSASARSQWINGLWFASLSLALIDALLSILAKQWLVEYASKMRRPIANAQRWAWRHHAFSRGLSKWGVGVFISSLAVILHLSLYLFLFGLLIFLFELDPKVCATSIVLTAAACAFHVAATFAPLWYGDCPTMTPFLAHLRYAFLSFQWLLLRCYEQIRATMTAAHGKVGRIVKESKSSQDFDTFHRPVVPATQNSLDAILSRLSAYDGESIIHGDEPRRDSLVILWMVDNLLTDADVSVAIQAIGALDMDAHENFNWEGTHPLRSDTLKNTILSLGCDLIYLNDTRLDNNTMRHAQQAAFLRTILFTRNYMWINIANGGLGSVSTYDLHILASMVQDKTNFPLSDLHSGLLKQLHAWYLNESFSQGDPMQLATCRMLMWSVAEKVATYPESCKQLDIRDLIVLASLAVTHWGSSSIFQKFSAIMYTWLSFKRKEAGAASELNMRCDALPCLNATSPHASALSAWAVILLSSSTLQLPHEDVSACQRIYCKFLRPPAVFYQSWPLEVIEAMLAWIPSAVDMDLEAVKNAAIIIRHSIQYDDQVEGVTDEEVLPHRGYDEQRNFWSSKLHGIVHRLFQLRKFEPSPGMIDLLFSSFALSRIAQHDNLVTKARRHLNIGTLLRESMISILQLRQDGTNAPSSTWSLALRVCSSTSQSNMVRLAHMFAVELALLSHPSLKTWLGPQIHLPELLAELASGDKGIQLALWDSSHFVEMAFWDSSHFVEMARHGRIVSEAWWQDTKLRLLSLSDEQWEQREDKHWHDSPQELVDRIEAVEECFDCTLTVRRLQELFANGASAGHINQQIQLTTGSQLVYGGTKGSLWRRLGTRVRSSVGLASPLPNQQSPDVEMQGVGSNETTEL